MDTIQLTTTVNNLTARLNAIDGQNLPDQTQAQLVNLQKQITGLQTTIRQVTLVLQANLKDLSTAVMALQTQVNQQMGVGPAVGV